MTTRNLISVDQQEDRMAAATAQLPPFLPYTHGHIRSCPATAGVWDACGRHKQQLLLSCCCVMLYHSPAHLHTLNGPLKQLRWVPHKVLVKRSIKSHEHTQTALAVGGRQRHTEQSRAEPGDGAQGTQAAAEPGDGAQDTQAAAG